MNEKRKKIKTNYFSDILKLIFVSIKKLGPIIIYKNLVKNSFDHQNTNRN